MRVLSRRSNLPEAVACGYSEGAGFACSNGTLPLALGPSAPHVGDPWTRRWRGVSPGAEGVHTRLCLRSHTVHTQPGAGRVPISRKPSALRRGEATTL